MATIAEFQSRLRDASKRPMLLDGAVGTELEKRSVPLPPGLWSAAALRSHPDVVGQIHREYAQAGADIIVANTFRVTHRILAATGLGMDGEYLAKRAVDLARAAAGADGAAGSPHWIAASVGPVADCYRPQDTPPDEVLRADYRRTLSWLARAQPDLLWIETMNTRREAVIAAELADHLHVPFVISFILQEDGRLLGGESLREGVDGVSRFGPLSIGLNCMPPSGLTRQLPTLRKVTSIPIAAYAHVGTGAPLPGWSYAESPTASEYVSEARRWHEAGASIIGGCCGTTPEFIKGLAESFG